ncbi:MAG: hypothetical protein GWM98_17400 [Nitrospinaceae bacterium]|nr:hypothetical protein [Nitrospinaceae bacterium]NIR55936.1 hypothetical protein [Nitrospinaceae bacterium]NIT83216.1 hypothetical protein [Nitrospinaceae bacterium]NIX35584.1 hypothetical protein [Nitrospinaceae bacterium]NIY16540.1 hypothetical protein [Nitrospinaceae bacterium]
MAEVKEIIDFIEDKKLDLPSLESLVKRLSARKNKRANEKAEKNRIDKEIESLAETYKNRMGEWEDEKKEKNNYIKIKLKMLEEGIGAKKDQVTNIVKDFEAEIGDKDNQLTAAKKAFGKSKSDYEQAQKELSQSLKDFEDGKNFPLKLKKAFSGLDQLTPLLKDEGPGNLSSLYKAYYFADKYNKQLKKIKIANVTDFKKNLKAKWKVIGEKKKELDKKESALETAKQELETAQKELSEITQNREAQILQNIDKLK